MVAERVVLLHGFTQTAECWGEFGTLLAQHHDVQALDLPGHGSRSQIETDLIGTAELLAADCEGAIVVGYSLGGRVALHVALRARLRGLVLIGATGGIDDDAERAARRAADEELAAHLEQIGVDAFLDEWLTQPLFAGLDAESSHLAQRRTNTVAGLASSLRRCGTGTQRPLWDDLSTLDAPTLVVSGANDAKFAALGDRLTTAIGLGARRLVIDDAGHSTHLERPRETADAVLAWIDSITLR